MAKKKRQSEPPNFTAVELPDQRLIDDARLRLVWRTATDDQLFRALIPRKAKAK